MRIITSHYVRPQFFELSGHIRYNSCANLALVKKTKYNCREINHTIVYASDELKFSY